MQLICEVAGVDAVAVFLMEQRTDSHECEPCAAQKAEKLIIFWCLLYQRWHCGNLIGMIHDAGVPMMCCGQKMTKLEPGVVEASHEKHIPVVSVDGNIVTVTIGSVEHPMLEEHHIEWVYLQTDKGGQRKCLEVGKPPVVTFALSDEKPIAAYEYCNLHGLWKADI